ncbi:MAG TPA: hypothetical protein QF695_08120 [Arenicellales bacterium]|jgi:hypothetical protein|nr:hypothetical protein [Pseudomonadales bacterium]MDP6317533.1 hypothetical protein [Pseudomonadales bacterium]HJL52590.1 hypothetical protein [Arenicellales bacterium]|tara:strand:- start:4476 stop:4619 length:144 start_codon:yes stop_codon:yes gene_type:complete
MKFLEKKTLANNATGPQAQLSPERVEEGVIREQLHCPAHRQFESDIP